MTIFRIFEIINILMILAALIAVVYLFILVVKALRKYIGSKEVREEKKEMRHSLGDVLRAERTRCKMTQEFVAESLGVSRQAVSKWENGVADPSTANLSPSPNSTASVPKSCLNKW